MTSETEKSGCQGGSCPHCAMSDVPTAENMTGWRLTLWSAGVFLLPLMLAFVGAIVFRGDALVQAGGVLAGLLIGFVVSAVIAKIIA